MPGVAYQVAGPVWKWEVAMYSLRARSLSRETVRFSVSADSDGYPYDPTGATVEVAFMGSAGDDWNSEADPAGDDWVAGTWDVTVTGNYVAQVLIGPGSSAQLEPATYRCWVRITDADSGEQVVRQVGSLLVV